jgi:DNA-binding LacI/PurR family transcriptional regulator
MPRKRTAELIHDMSKRLSAPSAHDVADLAGVSQAAVSRAFTPGASIAKGTQDKILRAAQSLGYRPNLLARSLIKGESGIIGVVIGNPRSIFFISALHALSARLSQAQKHILVFTAEAKATADVHVEDLLRYRVDALFLMGISLSPKLAEHCRDKGIPVIFFNLRSQEIEDFDSVTVNNREGARQIGEHLVEQGYRRLAFMGGPPAYSTSRERESAFNAYLASRGLPAPVREIGCYERNDALRATRSLLSRKSRPEAIFCWNDHMALAAIEVARYEFGLEIGRDLGIAGFGDIEQASWLSFDLTTYSQPVDAMIQEVAAILLATPRPKRPVHAIIDGTLKPRRSTQRRRN